MYILPYRKHTVSSAKSFSDRHLRQAVKANRRFREQLSCPSSGFYNEQNLVCLNHLARLSAPEGLLNCTEFTKNHLLNTFDLVVGFYSEERIKYITIYTYFCRKCVLPLISGGRHSLYTLKCQVTSYLQKRLVTRLTSRQICKEQ